MILNRRILSVLVLATILVYGFFKPGLCRVYSIPVSNLIERLGYDPDNILKSLNSLSVTSEYKNYYLGWFVYYPSYLLFHLIFIFVLFQENRKIRNIIAISLILFISLLVIFVLIFKSLGFRIFFEISYKLFQNLFSLPFILLAVEGSRILLSDLDSWLNKQQSDD